jgi:alpha-1,4-galacturonosyltransferase
MQKLREQRREKRATDLVLKDDEAHVKLENAAIERSKAVDSAVLGKYSIWRKENENENSDSTVRLMRDQIIMARVYSVLAKSKNKHDLYQELQSRIKESQRAVGEATVDADLHHRCVCASIIAYFLDNLRCTPFHTCYFTVHLRN